MASFRSGDQPDLFDNAGDISAAAEPPPDFVDRIRGELTNTLAQVRDAIVLPWSDLTAATLAELRFHSIAGWLPDDEATGLRVSFQREMTRLYAVAGENRTL